MNGPLISLNGTRVSTEVPVRRKTVIIVLEVSVPVSQERSVVSLGCFILMFYIHHSVILPLYTMQNYDTGRYNTTYEYITSYITNRETTHNCLQMEAYTEYEIMAGVCQ